MKIQPSILTVAILTLALIAAIMVAQWWSHRLRFDNVYQQYSEQIGFGDQYYRFYPDGTVLAHTGYAWRPAEEAKQMYRRSPSVYRGHYSREGGSISITADGWSGAILLEDADEATREAFERGPHTKTYHLSGEVRASRIEITSADGYGEYRFVKVQFPNET